MAQNKPLHKTVPGFNATPTSVVIGTAVTTVSHKMGFKPRGYIVTKLLSPSGFLIDANAISAWTVNTAYFKANKAATSAQILWL